MCLVKFLLLVWWGEGGWMDGRVGVYMRDDTMIPCTVLLSYLMLNNNVHYLTYFPRVCAPICER